MELVGDTDSGVDVAGGWSAAAIASASLGKQRRRGQRRPSPSRKPRAGAARVGVPLASGADRVHPASGGRSAEWAGDAGGVCG